MWREQLASCWTESRVRNRSGVTFEETPSVTYILQFRSHLLKSPEPPKAAPVAEDQAPSAKCEDISYPHSKQSHQHGGRANLEQLCRRQSC